SACIPGITLPKPVPLSRPTAPQSDRAKRGNRNPMSTHRRTVVAWFAAFCGLAIPQGAEGQAPTLPTFETYLRRSVVDKKTLEVFLDPKQLSWAKFDPITGYRLGNYLPKDGINQSSTISTSQSNGMRTAHAYVDKPCRINTYGDSFTLCHQVSDSETWQEYLAGHLGEPIRNFGMGGF